MVLDEAKKTALARLYSTPGSPAAFSNVNALYREVKRNRDTLPYITRADIVKFLSGIEAHTLTRKRYKPRRGKLPKIIASSQKYQFIADLANVSTYSEENDSVRYLLCVVDGFSRMGFVKKLTNKSGRSTVEALDRILDRSDGPPIKFQTDLGIITNY